MHIALILLLAASCSSLRYLKSSPMCTKVDFARKGFTALFSKPRPKLNKDANIRTARLLSVLPPKLFSPNDIMNPESYLKFFTYSLLVYLPEQEIKRFKGEGYYTGAFQVLVQRKQKGYKTKFLKDLDSVYVIFKNREEKTLTVSFRGTATKSDILADIGASPISPIGTLYFDPWKCPISPFMMRKKTFYIHKGFHDSLPFEVVGQIIADLKVAKENNPDYSIVLAGHSLGGVKVMLLALHLRLHYQESLPVAAIYSFGMPPVGSTAFNKYMANCIGLEKIVRIVTANDIVPWSSSWNGVQHFGVEVFNPDPLSPVFHKCKSQLDTRCSAGIMCSKKSFANHGNLGGIRGIDLVSLLE